MSGAMREAFEELEWLYKSSNLPDRAAKYNKIKAALSGAQQGEVEGQYIVKESSDGDFWVYLKKEPGPILPIANCYGRGTANKVATALNAATAPQPAQVPEGWRLVPVEPTTEMLGEGAIALFAQSREPLSSAYRNMLAAAPRCPMLTAAPSGDAKREALPITEYIVTSEDEDVVCPEAEGIEPALATLEHMESRSPDTAWHLVAVVDVARLRQSDSCEGGVE